MNQSTNPRHQSINHTYQLRTLAPLRIRTKINVREVRFHARDGLRGRVEVGGGGLALEGGGAAAHCASSLGVLVCFVREGGWGGDVFAEDCLLLEGGLEGGRRRCRI